LRLIWPICRIHSSTRARAWLIAVSLSIVQVIGGGISAGLAQEPIPVKREILALYDGAQESDPDSTRIHRFAEMPLNHLGFILRFNKILAKPQSR
jgi:polysaccharide biosynthesis protein PelA